MRRYGILSKGRIATRGVRNKTESRYEETLIADPNVVSVWFESLRLCISHVDQGKSAYYTPDFLVLYNDGTTCIDEVKGAGPPDLAAIVRMKAAADKYPLWRFRMCKERKRKDGGGFDITYV